MSYCVNCGVELDATLRVCPLCNTPVINPKEIQYDQNGRIIFTGAELPTPFPTEKGQVEMIKRKDMAILVTTVALATSVVCGLLNVLVFSAKPWSLAIIGACVLLWVMMIPGLVYTKQSIYTSILLDGIAAAAYLFMLTYLSGSRGWFWGLGVPIVVLITILTELFAICMKLLPRSFLGTALYAFTMLALLSVGLEFIIDKYARGEVILRWSAIVTTVCIIVDITIVTVLSRKQLRNEVRRRLHF